METIFRQKTKIEYTVKRNTLTAHYQEYCVFRVRHDLMYGAKYIMNFFSEQIDCRELRQSSPLSQVVPPKSKANLPIVFESNVKGNFQR